MVRINKKIIFMFIFIFSLVFVAAQFGYDDKSAPRLEVIKKKIETFLDLKDTPNTYLGQGGKCVKVNNTENGLEFMECGNGNFSFEKNGNISFLLGGGRTGEFSAAALSFLAFFGDGAPSTSFEEKRVIVPFNFTIKNMQVSKASGNVGVNYTLYLNGNPTALTCRTTGVLATCSNKTVEVKLKEGDYIALGIQPDNIFSSFGNIRFSFEGIKETIPKEENNKTNTIIYQFGLRFSGSVTPGNCVGYRTSQYIPPPFWSGTVSHSDSFIIVDAGNITRFSTSVRVNAFNNSGNVTGAFLNYTLIINETERVFLGRQSFNNVSNFFFVNRTLNIPLDLNSRIILFYEWELQNATGGTNNMDFCYNTVSADIEFKK